MRVRSLSAGRGATCGLPLLRDPRYRPGARIRGAPGPTPWTVAFLAVPLLLVLAAPFLAAVVPSAPPLVTVVGSGTRDLPGNVQMFFRSATDPSEVNCNVGNMQLLPAAGSTPLTIVLANAFDVACWYDQVGGQAYPAGTWEIILDVSQSGNGQGAKYDVKIDVWDEVADTSPSTICLFTGQNTYGLDVTYTCAGVGARNLGPNEVVRASVMKATGARSVVVAYDDAYPSATDSRITTPIPEYDVLLVAAAVPLVLLVARRRRR